MVTKREAKIRARRLAEVLNCPYEDVSLFFLHACSLNIPPHSLGDYSFNYLRQKENTQGATSGFDDPNF